MTPSRRQFVAALAAVPFVSQAASAQRRTGPRAADPVLEQIMTDLRTLGSEFEKAQPGSRKSTLRAMESTLAVGAAHLATHYDADFRRALRRRQDRAGRAALVQELVEQAHEAKSHAVSHDGVDAAIARLERQGLSGAFRDIEQTIRKIRVQAPEQLQAARSGTIQFDYCSDLNWMIGMMEGITSVVCGIAILEPGPGGEIACGALMLALGLLYIQRQWFC